MDPQALSLAQRTLTPAITILMNEGASFAPLVAFEKDGVLTSERIPFQGTSAAATARIFASSRPECTASAFAIPDTVVVAGQSHRALVVEAWNFRTGRGAQVALRFEVTGLRRKISLLGTPLHFSDGGWRDPDDLAPVEHPEPTASMAVNGSDTTSMPLGNQTMFLAMNELMTHGSPFAPFAIVQKGGVRQRVNMTDPRAEVAAAAVHEYALSRPDADFIAYAVDAYTTIEGDRTDTILVEVLHPAGPHKFVLGQAYGPHDTPSGLAFIGRPMTSIPDGTWAESIPMEMGGEVLYSP